MGRKILALLLLLFVFLTPAFADEDGSSAGTDENVQAQIEAAGADELINTAPDTAKEILDQLQLGQFDYRRLLSLTPGELWQVITGYITSLVRAPLVLLGVLIVIVVLCALVDALKTSFGAKGLEKVFHGVAVVCLVSAVLGPVTGCIQKASQAIAQASEFMVNFVPVFCGILTAGGQPVSAGVYHLILFGSSQVVGQAAAEVLVPLIGIFLAFTITGAIAPELHLDEIAKTVKKFVNWSLGLLLTFYVGLLGLQGVVAASADTLALKTAKFVTSSFVPVIGSALSEALGAAQACLKLLKTSVGAYGTLIAAFTFLPVLLEIVCWYLVMHVASLFGQFAGAGKIAKVLDGAAAALGLLMSITLLFGLLFIVTTTVMLLFGTGG